MEITITLPDNLASKLQNLPNPNAYVSGLVQKALKNPTVPPGMEINVMEMIEQIREKQYEAFKKCKTVEQKIAFYREGARIAEERAKKRRLELQR
jgi:hypothetical protein